MSVSQVKKQFADFHRYLNNDKEGHRRLKMLKDTVNAVRVVLNATERKCEELEKENRSLREHAHQASQKCDDVTERNQSLSEQLRRAQMNVTRLEGMLTAPDPPDEHFPETTWSKYAEVRHAVRRMRKHMKYMPAPVHASILKGSPWVHTYDRMSLVAGWSHNDMWLLGTTIASAVFLVGGICITSDDMYRNRRSTDDELESLGKQLTQWYAKNNIDTRDDAASVLCRATS